MSKEEHGSRERGRFAPIRRDVIYHRRTGAQKEHREPNARGVAAEYIWAGDSKAASGHIVSWFFTSQKPKRQKESERHRVRLATGDWWLISWHRAKFFLDEVVGISEDYTDAIDAAFSAVRPDVALLPTSALHWS
ncbi:unnamed protein product [Amoebophrya sp. A120]|nr:unnamed protein product [Amoebophrya sp. A120]|eukprot:GSA120T00024104001.1